MGFLLTGLVLLILGSSLQGIRQVPIESRSNSWEISADLEKEETYSLDIVSSEKWRDDYTGGAYETPQPSDLVVTSPNGGETKLQVFFYARLPSSQYYKSTLPAVVDVEYVSVDSHSLNVDESSSHVRFTTKEGGNYTARIVEQTLNWTAGPPEELKLYKEIIESQALSVFFLPSGGILCMAGVVASIYGARATKRSRIRQERKPRK